MNEIIEKTRELGELIQNSEEMKNAKNAEILQENDDEAQALLKEFNLQRMNLARKTTRFRVKKLYRRITKHLKKCLKNRNQ